LHGHAGMHGPCRRWMEIRWPKATVSSTRARGAARAAGFGREGGRGGLGLTGDGRGKAAGSRRVVGIAERGEVGLGGVLLLLPSSSRR
jgi:hypothetical protein